MYYILPLSLCNVLELKAKGEGEGGEERRIVSLTEVGRQLLLWHCPRFTVYIHQNHQKINITNYKLII